MKNILAILGWVVGIFFIHLFVFFLSDSYRDVLRSFKYDSYQPTIQTETCHCEEVAPEKEIIYRELPDIYAPIKTQLFEWYREQMQKIVDRFDKYGFIEEGEFWQSVPFGFESDALFAVFERQDYQGQFLYFFPGISFQILQDTYQTLGEQMEIFSINEVDYIADRAFFLNRFPEDDLVRLIIQKDENIFWLMMKKEYYDDIREIVQNFNF